MTDILDRAQALEEMQRNLALQRRFKAVHQSETHCIICGEPIPERRRQLVQGCQTCIECQQQSERKAKAFRK